MAEPSIGDCANDTPLAFTALALGREIGRGAFSRVYLGSYDGHDVAIKKITLQAKDAEKYLMTELGILKSMVHPNLIHYFGAAFNRPDIFIVTEFMNGGSESNFAWSLFCLTRQRLKHSTFRVFKYRLERGSAAHCYATPLEVEVSNCTRYLLWDFVSSQP